MNIKLFITTLTALIFVSFNLVAEEATIVKSVQPDYPQSALKRQMTGWAVVEYDVNERGRAENIVVTSSEPASVFDRAAIKAMRATRFEKISENGEPKVFTGQRMKYVFEIDEEVPGALASDLSPSLVPFSR